MSSTIRGPNDVSQVGSLDSVPKSEDSRAPGRHGRLHPVMVMLLMIVAAAVLTHIVQAGRMARVHGRVVPGTYHVLPKVGGLPALLSPSPPSQTDSPARAAGLVALVTSIPAGMMSSATLIVMVMSVGGMFGVLRATGAVDAGVDRLLNLTSGNTYLLTGGLLFPLALGSTFLGFISEYLAIIPLVLTVAQRLRLPNLFAPAIVVTASMVGITSSVTNPIHLSVAQPLAGVPIFSGVEPRLTIFAVMFIFALCHVLLYVRRLPKTGHFPKAARLTRRQAVVLIYLVGGALALVVGTSLWLWGTAEHAAFFIAFGMSLAVVGGLKAGAGADAFIGGMQGMLLACVMIGLGGAVQVILQSSQVLDSMTNLFSATVRGHTPSMVALGMMLIEMTFDVLIHSTAALAAITVPILAPIAHLSGVSGQVTVTALLLGSGLMNMISPTNGLLLAFLAASRVGYIQWVRFIAPLFLLLCVVGFAALYLMTRLGM